MNDKVAPMAPAATPSKDIPVDVKIAQPVKDGEAKTEPGHAPAVKV